MARARKTMQIAVVLAAVLFFGLAVPVFASGLMDMLERASGTGESGKHGPAVALTSQIATIEAMSTEIAGFSDASVKEIELAVVQTLAVEGLEIQAAKTPHPGFTPIP